MKQSIYENKKFTYDYAEDFQLSDGGEITLHGKGDLETGIKPVVLVLCGQSHNSLTGIVRKAVNMLKDSFDVVVINYRGHGVNSEGAKQVLKTPRWINGGAVDDFLEPARYIYEKFCKEKNRKVFGLGISLGSLVMTNSLNQAEFLTAAVMLWHPTDMGLVMEHLEKAPTFHKVMGDISLK